MLKVKFKDKSKKNEEVLEELFRVDFKRLIDTDYKDHEKNVELKTNKGSLKFNKMEGPFAYFTMESFSDDKKYVLVVKFEDFQKIMSDSELSTARQKAFALVKGPMSSFRVHCTCPSYRYNYQYVATGKDAAAVPQDTPADLTNPSNRGVVCKHLDVLISVLPMNAMRFVSAIKAQMG
jgi:hypothetical protein